MSQERDIRPGDVYMGNGLHSNGSYPSRQFLKIIDMFKDPRRNQFVDWFLTVRTGKHYEVITLQQLRDFEYQKHGRLNKKDKKISENYKDIPAGMTRHGR